MSLELTTLRLLKSRANFNKIAPGLNLESSGFTEHTTQVVQGIAAFYKEFPDANNIDPLHFKVWFHQFHAPQLSEDKAGLVSSVIDAMKTDVPPEMAGGLVERILQQEFAVKLLTEIQKWNNGGEFDLFAVVPALTEQYNDRLNRKVKTPRVTASPEELMQMDEHHTGVNWRLMALRRSMRELRSGDFGIWAMRPDAGKTTCLTSESSFWLPQLDAVWPGEDRIGVWLNNEGPGARIKQRWLQSVLGATIPEMVDMLKLGKLSDNIAAALDGTSADRMHFYDVHDFYSHEVDQLLASLPVGFCIFDMIDNIKFSGMAANNGQRTDQLLEEMYKWGRNSCVKRDFFGVATSQLSADAQGVPYPPQSALKDSKTGKQGACDFIITGGKLDDPAMDGVRYLGAPKNKLHRTGGPRDPRCEVLFDPERARVSDPEV
jgi:hypothetical protein